LKTVMRTSAGKDAEGLRFFALILLLMLLMTTFNLHIHIRERDWAAGCSAVNYEQHRASLVLGLLMWRKVSDLRGTQPGFCSSPSLRLREGKLAIAGRA